MRKSTQTPGLYYGSLLDAKFKRNFASILPATGDLLLIWNNTFTEGAGHGGKRTPLTAAISNDEGQTWTVVNNLEDDTARTFSYTSLTFVGDRAVMSYWDNVGSRYSCRFRSVPVDWFYTSKH